jgi:hypothetical protein
MYHLFDELLEGWEKDVTVNELEEAIGAGQGIISHQRNSSSDISFVNVLRSVRYICPSEEKFKMEQFIKAFTSENNLRVSLEYALSIRDFALAEWVMNKLTEIGKAKNIDWVKTYEIVKAFQERKLNLKDLSHLVKTHNPKNTETKILTNILQCYVYFYKQNWTDINELLPEIREDIKSIKKNDYLKTTFSIRLSELVSHMELHSNNNVEEARKLANQANESEFAFKFNLHTHYILGKSFMLEDYDISLSHFQKYVEELRNHGDYDTAANVEKMDIAFLNNHWGVDHDLLDDEAETIHYHYMRGNMETARDLLGELKKKGDLTPFQKYYEGLIEDSGEILMESMMDFIHKGDFFFANLPLRKLQDLQAYNVIATMIYGKLIRKERN